MGLLEGMYVELAFLRVPVNFVRKRLACVWRRRRGKNFLKGIKKLLIDFGKF